MHAIRKDGEVTHECSEVLDIWKQTHVFKLILQYV